MLFQQSPEVVDTDQLLERDVWFPDWAAETAGPCSDLARQDIPYQECSPGEPSKATCSLPPLFNMDKAQCTMLPP